MTLNYNTTVSKLFASYLQPSYRYTQEEETEIQQVDDETQETNTLHERVLTYYRNEILITPISNIAYIYIENATTLLDSKSFFRVNRQIILSISAIQKIINMGKGQLKIETSPGFEKSIYIGKNKSSAFKKWLHH